MNPSPKKLRFITVFLVATVLLALSVVIFSRWDSKQNRIMNDLPIITATKEAVPMQVEVARARIGDLVMRLSVTGLTRALREITISPKVGGEIVELAVTEGQFVQPGSLLMKLDDREYRLALAEARDKLLGAQVEFGLLVRDEERGEGLGNKGIRDSLVDRRLTIENRSRSEEDQAFLETLQKKFEQGEITSEEFFKAKLEYETEQVLSGEKRQELMAHKSGLTAAALAVQRAELNLSYTEIRAPFSGFIGDLEVEEGQQVTAGHGCCKLVDLSEIEVELQVLESEVGLVKEGRQAEVTFPAYPGETFHGRVVRTNPVVDPESKTTKVTVRLENPDERILPGMFAYAKLEAQIFKERLLVPKEAILIRDQRKPCPERSRGISVYRARGAGEMVLCGDRPGE